MTETALSRFAARTTRAIERSKPDAFSSVALTVPVFLIYHLGILLIDKRNGVDLVSELTFRLLEQSVAAYVGMTLGLAVGILVLLWLLRRRGKLRPADPARIAAESLTWAALMLVSVGNLTQRLTNALSLSTPTLALGPLEKLVMAAGAGFHEETVIRVALLSGGAIMLQAVLGLQRLRALLFAALLSSVAFAFVHHLGPLGEPLALTPLLFRTLAGVFLSAVYLLRGFAIAVYTHTFYDALVFFVL